MGEVNWIVGQRPWVRPCQDEVHVLCKHGEQSPLHPWLRGYCYGYRCWVYKREALVWERDFWFGRIGGLVGLIFQVKGKEAQISPKYLESKTKIIYYHVWEDGGVAMIGVKEDIKAMIITVGSAYWFLSTIPILVAQPYTDAMLTVQCQWIDHWTRSLPEQSGRRSARALSIPC